MKLCNTPTIGEETCERDVSTQTGKNVKRPTGEIRHSNYLNEQQENGNLLPSARSSIFRKIGAISEILATVTLMTKKLDLGQEKLTYLTVGITTPSTWHHPETIKYLELIKEYLNHLYYFISDLIRISRMLLALNK